MSGENQSTKEKENEVKSVSDVEMKAAKIVDTIRSDIRKSAASLSKVDPSLNQKNNPLYISCLNLQIALSNLDVQFDAFEALVKKDSGAADE